MGTCKSLAPRKGRGEEGCRPTKPTVGGKMELRLTESGGQTQGSGLLFVFTPHDC
jgi:hypothetical protein